MFLLVTIAVAVTFTTTIGAVVLMSVDRAAALVDKPAMDLVLPRK